MTHSLHMNSFQKVLACLVLCAGFTLPIATHAALVSLTSPLASATTANVLPNIMFILDDSGSMDWDYLPDWANDTDPFTGTGYNSEPPLFTNNGFNGVAYNPAITYSQPVYYTAAGVLDTTTYPSQTGQSAATGADATAKPNWKAVKNDGYGIQFSGTSNLVGNASSYVFVPGEYCTNQRLTSCVAATAPSTSYPHAAPLRWCDSAAMSNCQSINNSTFRYPRYPGQGGSTATITVSTGGGGNTSVSSIKVNGLEILSGSTGNQNSNNNLASAIASNINNCTTAISGSCQIAGYRASRSGSVVTVTAPGSLGAITYTPGITKSGGRTVTTTAFSGQPAPGSNLLTNIVSTNNSYPYPGTTSKASTRTDCVGTTCTYVEEMTNYANWWAYYHTRMQSMKTAVSRAFKNINNRYRVGFSTISYSGATDGTKFLGNDTFENTYKKNWFTRLFAQNPGNSTPLRGALSKAGLYYANKISGQVDPIQYSCQQNFTILSTDGYWNTGDETSTYTSRNLTGGAVGNQDGGTTPRPMKEGTTAVSDTLADIAKYYYDTDLRTPSLGNCTGVPVPPATTGNIICSALSPDPYNDVFVSTRDNNTKQHMTTFSIGLGADGTLVYQDDYLTANSGDFYDLSNNLNGMNWSNPIANSAGERIDDLWHAAVNGHGQYFSAKTPDEIVKGLNTALASITAKLGAGAAAATSTLNPVAANNKAFVASYTTVSWRGNLEARLIDLTTGATSDSAVWCAEDVAPPNCNAPSYLENDTSNSSNVWYCVTPSVTTCSGGTLVGTDCKVEVAASCKGTLKAKISPASDSRVIYMKDATGSNLIKFDYDNMTVNQKAYFDSTSVLNGLSQWPTLTADQQNSSKPNFVGGKNLVNFLRGQYGYEERTANTDKLYRYREATMGDAIESQPVFIGKPTFSYTDTGYDTFKTAQAGRAKTVFLGTNDGMLHAFDADTGEERWAFVPSMVMPNLWKLADKSYATMHTNYVNGAAVTGDIYDGTWKSILVGSLHGGGRGFYAMDVTDPAAPKFLWEFTYTQSTDHALKMDDNVGYSFAEPKIGKRPTDGKWVVFLTSGYNNVNPGDATGWIYELDPISGAILHQKSTGVGDKVTPTPSGLAKIEFYADSSERDNTAKFIYGGDLLGNLWRLDMSDYSLLKFAILKDGAGNVQPITTRPEFASIDNKRVVYVATGKHLEIADLTNNQKNTIYAIKDDDATATFINPRSGTGADLMLQRTITDNGAFRTVSGTDVVDPFLTYRGWYADLPDSQERANVDPRLEFGTLIVPTTVPTSTACTPDGYGWINFVDYKTGKAVANATNAVAGVKTNTPPVGINIVMLPDGTIVASVVETGDPTPKPVPDVAFSTKAGGFQGKRVIWRELVP